MLGHVPHVNSISKHWEGLLGSVCAVSHGAVQQGVGTVVNDVALLWWISRGFPGARV
jgi:hypothetical protein